MFYNGQQFRNLLPLLANEQKKLFSSGLSNEKSEKKIYTKWFQGTKTTIDLNIEIGFYFQDSQSISPQLRGQTGRNYKYLLR